MPTAWPQSTTRDQLERQSVKLSTVLCLISLIIPALAAVGWMFDVPLLTRGHSTLPAMQPNTVFGLVVLAVAVLLTQEHVVFSPRTWVAVLLASVVLLLGLFTLGEYAFGWESGLDRIFVHHSARLSQPYPGRPSPQTALNFALLGVVLLGFNLSIRTFAVAQIAAIAAAANAVVIATGEIFGASSIYGLPIYEPSVGMALHTAITFILLVVALFCRRPREGLMTLVTSETHAGRLARRIVLAAIVAPPLVGTLTHVGVVAGWYDLRAQIALFALAMTSLILRTTWRAARQSEHAELRAREAFEALERANEQLSRAVRERQVFAALVDNSPDFIGITDPKGTPTYVNPAGRRMVGLSSDVLLERTAIPDYYAGDQREFASNVIVKSMIEGGHWEGETAFRHWQTNESIPVSDTHFMIRHPETNEILGMGTITRDISEAKRVQREIETANRKLRQADELKTNFFANVSHEFRTPLSLILGPVEHHLASADALSPELRRDLEVVDRSARTLLRYVDDLLDVARIDAGQLQPEYAEADAAAAVRYIGEHFSALATERSIAFSIDTPEALAVQTDLKKLERILLNLLSNAFKFTPNGGRIRVSLSDRPGRMQIEVADSGPGIPESRRTEVFERFHQLQTGATSASSGAGLGLSIVKEFTTLLGGGISIAEAPEGGSLFVVDLPSRAPTGAAVKAPVAEGRKTVELKRSIEAVGESSPGDTTVESSAERRPVVLVVEDNRDMRRFVAECLRSEGFAVVTAADGPQGYDAAIELKPDVLVTDIMMPNMNGDELVRRLRERVDLASMPIVVLTAKADRDFRIKLLRGGADDYLDKPFSREELCARVRILATRKRAEDRSNDLLLQVEDVSRASKSVADAVASLPESSMLAVLQTIALKASSLTSAEYGAVGIGTDPDRSFQTWAFAGIDHAQAVKIGAYPHPRGLLGLVTTRDRPLRLRDVREHPAFGGFPQHHPLMTSFMGMPIRYKGHAVGNLYVANKRGAAEFTERDEQLIEMLANGVGVAIETARLFTAEGLERAWLETVVDQMPEGVLLMDAEGRVTVANRFMRSLASVDTPQRDRFGNPMRFDLRYPSGARLSPDDLPIVKALIEKVTSDGHEFVARRADGRLVPLLVSAAPIRSANGTIAGATMILQDASTLKELEQMREEWATIVAHDLQQPIHTILLRSDLLASGPLTAEQAEGVRQVRVAVKRLSRMVRDLMEASKLETRRLQISFDRVDLGRLIRDIVVRIPDVASRVEVSTPSRQSLFVRGDPERLEQVVTNLLSNAVKYGASDAPIKVDVVVDAGYAQVSVTNSGAGISAAELPFVFERYARSHSARTTGIKGLGLGLYIAKGLIEGHGGRIWVESVPDKTTTFHFTVPLDDFGYATTSLVESPDRRIESTVEFHP